MSAEVTAADIRMAVRTLMERPYSACRHIVHPNFRGLRMAMAEDEGKPFFRTTCAQCGATLVLVMP